MATYLAVVGVERLVFGAWNHWPLWPYPILVLVLVASFWTADRVSVLL
jgi:hypothetical protein